MENELTKALGKEKTEEDPKPVPVEDPEVLPDTNIDDEEFNEDLDLEKGLDDDELFDEEDDYNN